MWRRWLVGVGVASATSAACGSPYDRASFELASVQGVLFSNSLVVSGKVLPERTDSSVSLTYPLLFQNQGNEVATLALAGAVALLDGEQGRVVVRCGEHGYLPSASLSLQPADRVRVDCVLTLTAAGLAVARSGDSELVLEVPVLSGGRMALASFSYRFVLEDVS